MDAVDKAQKQLGIRMPATARAFYRSPKKLNNLYPPSIRDLLQLTHVYPATPARFLPFFNNGCGDLLGLYLPRRGRPLVAGFDHEQSNLIPLSTDAEGLFRNPDAFVFNDPEEPRRSFWRKSKVIGSLRIRPEAKVPELELLKPFALHYDPLVGLDPAVFEPLLKRFRSERKPARLVREAFSDVTSLHDRGRWMSLATRLDACGFPLQAIAALENCNILHFIHPTYGDPHVKSDWAWVRVLEVLERLTPLYERHGDDLDRILNRRQVEMARGYVRTWKL